MESEKEKIERREKSIEGKENDDQREEKDDDNTADKKPPVQKKSEVCSIKPSKNGYLS